jgi:hypothetical protein
MDKQRVWLLQFCPLKANEIHKTFGARTDVFFSKGEVLRFVTGSSVYQNVNLKQLDMSDTSDAEYTNNKGKLYIFHTTIR